MKKVINIVQRCTKTTEGAFNFNLHPKKHGIPNLLGRVGSIVPQGTPLHWAAFNGHSSVVEQLLAAGGVDVAAQDGQGLELCWLGLPVSKAAVVDIGRQRIAIANSFKARRLTTWPKAVATVR